MDRDQTGDTRSRAVKRLWLSAILGVQVLVLVPGTIYLGNLAEFVAPAGALLQSLSIAALLFLLVILVIGGMVERGGPGRFVALIAAFTLLTWLQAHVLVWDYGPLDGRNIDWSEATWRGWLDLAIWIAVLVGAAIFHRRVERPLVAIVTLLFAAQCVVLASLAVRHWDALRDKGSSMASSYALEPMQQFSSSRNVLHVILDSFQTDIFQNIVNDGGGYYRTALDGFVLYEENAGIFPYTQFALPAILSTRIYRNQVPKDEFIRDVFAGKTILNAAHDAGFEVDLATEPFMLDMLTNGRFTNSYLIPGRRRPTRSALVRDEAAELIDVSLFRIAPHFLKRYIYNDQSWFVQKILSGSSLMRFYFFGHNAFLASLAENMSVDRSAPVYKFFHLMSPHAPIVATPDCAFAGTVLPRIRATVTAQSRCTLDVVVELLDKMKELGIYDDALIVLIADHGGHIPPDRYRPASDGSESRGDVVNSWLVAMATPLMLVKMPQASGPLRTSAAPASLLDTPATVSAALGLEAGFAGIPVNEIPENEARERPFYHYVWRKADYVTDYVLPIRQLRITGSAFHHDSWQFIEEFPPPAGAE